MYLAGLSYSHTHTHTTNPQFYIPSLSFDMLAAFSHLFALGLLATGTLADTCKPKPFSDFVNNVVFTPADDAPSWGTIYARSLQLKDGSLITSWENYPPEPPLITFPIWKSDDGGASWYDFKNVTDDVNGWGLRWQPHFHRLEHDYGSYEAGTILLSGMSVKKDLSEGWLDIYYSTDEAETWSFATHVAYSPGPLTTNNGDKAIWEPFLLEHDGKLICYFSDQRDGDHGQKLVHVVTADLETWTEPVDDVAYDNYEARPGMTTVAHIESTGKFILTYEICGLGGCPSYFKVADSPYEFQDAEGVLITDNVTGADIGSSPYVIWVPHPEREDGSGLILLNGSGSSDVFVNDDDASPDGWRAIKTGMWAGHSRQLQVIEIKGKKKLLLSVGGFMQSDTDNKVAVGVIPIPT